MKNLRRKATALVLSLISLMSWQASLAWSRGRGQEAQSAKPSTHQGERRKERFVIPKPEKTTVNDKARADVLVLKFREGTRVRSRSGRLAADPAGRSRAEERLLGRANLDQAQVSRDLARVNDLVEGGPGVRLERLFKQPEETLDREKQEGESESGEELADLNLYYHLLLENAEKSQAEQLLDTLNALDSVEIAYPQPVPEPAQADIPPVTPDLTNNQGYLNAAPNGIDARHAWTHAGGRGVGVQVIDVEQGWNLNHEDLGPVFFQDGSFTGDGQHGTAVLGEIVGADNVYGVTGIAPQAAAGVASVNRCSVFCWYSVADAVNSAAAQLRRGDILLIEQHAQGPDSGQECQTNCDQFEFIPMEYWQAEFDAIRTATARGIIVVEAGGNGSMDLDSSIYECRFNRACRDSGAILVGAGSSFSRAPHLWSNSGGRLDVQGWGDSVTTLGYGDRRINGDDANQWYTHGFGGTSSASPIVAGAAAAVQGIRGARGLPPLDAFQMRALLRDTGTAQAASARQIGPLPDLRAAIALIENPATTLVHNQFVTVRESDYDVNTGIDVIPGDRLVFSAGGEIWAGVWFTGNNGPEGWDSIENGSSFPLPGSRPFSLLGKLGSRYFYVGRNLERSQTEAGAARRLYLRINDNVPGNGSGAFNCQVQVWRSLSNAAFVSQSVPVSMIAGQSYNVSVTMSNSGASTWTAPYLFRLGSQSPENNLTWGRNRVELPAGPVPPGGTATFNFNVTAPSTPGTYTFQWRMVQEGVQWFGDYSPPITITVNSSNRYLSLNVVSNSRTATTETITVYATDAATGAPVAGTVSANGAVRGQTGQPITYAHSVRVCEYELRRAICWYEPLEPTTFTVAAPGYDTASFTR